MRVPSADELLQKKDFEEIVCLTSAREASVNLCKNLQWNHPMFASLVAARSTHPIVSLPPHEFEGDIHEDLGNRELARGALRSGCCQAIS
jgi:hypothetical protein